jgi:hypothetical protein
MTSHTIVTSPIIPSAQVAHPAFGGWQGPGYYFWPAAGGHKTYYSTPCAFNEGNIEYTGQPSGVLASQGYKCSGNRFTKPTKPTIQYSPSYVASVPSQFDSGEMKSSFPSGGNQYGSSSPFTSDTIIGNNGTQMYPYPASGGWQGPGYYFWPANDAQYDGLYNNVVQFSLYNYISKNPNAPSKWLKNAKTLKKDLMPIWNDVDCNGGTILIAAASIGLPLEAEVPSETVSVVNTIKPIVLGEVRKEALKLGGETMANYIADNYSVYYISPQAANTANNILKYSNPNTYWQMGLNKFAKLEGLSLRCK